MLFTFGKGNNFQQQVSRICEEVIKKLHLGFKQMSLAGRQKATGNKNKLKTSKGGNCIASLSSLLHCLSVEIFSLCGQTSSGLAYPEMSCRHLGGFQHWLGEAQSKLVLIQVDALNRKLHQKPPDLSPLELYYDPVKGSRETISVKVM